jgi:UDP-N-acetylglucosamine 3-dehydrogenase
VLARIALIGNGKWGANVERTLNELPTAKLAYVAGRDWRGLLSKADIDGVVIATPPSSHAEIALTFIERGIPVFIEKPMTPDGESAQKIVDASVARNSPVQVGHIHLYNPAFEAFTAALPSLGRLISLSGEESHVGPIRSDYSVLWDAMPHDLSMMISIAGLPEEARAKGTDAAPGTRLFGRGSMELRFPGGVTGTIRSDWFGPVKKRRFEAVCENGAAVYDDCAPVHKVIVTDVAGIETHPSYPAKQPLACELAAFVDTVQNGTKPRSDAALGCAVVRILEQAGA